MSEPTPAQQHEEPPPSADPHEILRQASGGRLLVRLLVVAVTLGALGAGIFFGR